MGSVVNSGGWEREGEVGTVGCIIETEGKVGAKNQMDDLVIAKYKDFKSVIIYFIFQKSYCTCIILQYSP